MLLCDIFYNINGIQIFSFLRMNQRSGHPHPDGTAGFMAQPLVEKTGISFLVQHFLHSGHGFSLIFGKTAHLVAPTDQFLRSVP